MTPRTTPRRSSFDLAAMLIANEQEPPEWCEAFKSVKFDTADNPDYAGDERWIVVVAKGEAADRIAAAYRETRSQ